MVSAANNFVYREGSIADKNQLKELGIISYGQYYDLLAPEHALELKHVLEDDEKLLELIDKSKIFVCLCNDRIIGMAYIVPRGNAWDTFKAEWAYIRMVGVDPGFKGFGIATILTNNCIDHAKSTNEKFIALHTSEFMDAARHVYEKSGFKKINEVKPRFGKKYWLYLLELQQ